MTPLKTLLALCALIVLAAGCGGGVPGSAVATVDGESIDRDSFERWVAAAAKSSDRPEGRRASEALREQVLGQLISYRWVAAEASEREIAVTDAEVRKAFEDQKHASFAEDADYRKFLADSGQTEQDLLERVRIDLLQDRLRDEVIKGKARVTDVQVAAYYEKNKASFAEPERRDLAVVLTRTRAAAERARAALAAGGSWKSVAKEHSIDEVSRAAGGRLPGVASGQQLKAFDVAIFKARRGELTGPVKTRLGYYVFEVEKIARSRQLTLAQATPTIEQRVSAESQQKMLEEFLDGFRKKWRARTECQQGYEVTSCKT